MGHETVVLDELKGVVVVSTVAAIGVGFTVNELLLGEVHGLTALDLVEGFDSADGGEGPARPALALVLDSSDASPVDSLEVAEGSVGGDILSVSHTLRAAGSEVNSSKLFLSESHEGSFGEEVGLSGVSVVSLDLGKILLVDGKAISVFGWGVLQAEFALPSGIPGVVSLSGLVEEID